MGPNQRLAHVDAAVVKRLLFTAAVFGGALLWLLAVYLLSLAIADLERFAGLLPWILLVNIVGLTTLLLLIIARLVQLRRNWRERVTGSRLEARMVWMSGLLAVTPLLVVFYFSVQFINRSIESWFDVEIGSGLRSAVNLARASLQLQSREYLYRTETMAIRLAQSANVATLDALRQEYGAEQASIVDASERILGFSATSTAAVLPAPLSHEALLQSQMGRPYVSLEPVRAGQYRVRTAVQLPAALTHPEPRVLQVIFPVDAGLGELTEVVESSTKQYGELVRAREPLKTSFTLTLTLVLVMSVFGAIYGAMWAARRLVKPIENLVSGTRAVARGDFDTRLPLTSHDEMGMVVHSFNDMTKRLAEARRQTVQSQQAVEAERTRLAVILARLSTGVIALEPDLTVRTANEAAGHILGVDVQRSVGRPLGTLASDGQPVASQFVESCERHLQAGEQEWREQLSLSADSPRRGLVCACTAIPGDAHQPGGYVVVFDDITALLQAQRDAAWGEVARRLAHEIKNPLTPIRLSAERLQHKLRDSLDASEAAILERATATIVQHVDAMKNMVNAFSQYARAPDMTITRFDINSLILEVVELYRAEDPQLVIRTALDPTLTDIQADSGRVRQVLHNLLKNSLEAFEGQRGEICIRTAVLQRGGGKVMELVVEDDGPGFQPEFFGRMFDPYVTSKTKGTGLGLAIVKKIVEEHGGYIEAKNRVPGTGDRRGAVVRLELPLVAAPRSSAAILEPRHNESRREKT